MSGYPSPILAVIGSGGGKTSLLRTLAAQQFRNRWPAVFIDPHDAHGWTTGLARVTRWTSLDDAEPGLIRLGVELERRDRMESSREPTLLVVDDIDLLMPRLEARWT